jgi:GST-like protein
MVDLYFWTTPNGYKPLIMLMELEIDYRLIPINIGTGEQFKPEFLKIAPNNRIPALVDLHPEDGGPPLPIFESGAILEYLADKYQCFLPRQTRPRFEVLQWLYWQMGGLGPMAGQNHHFSHYAAEKIPYAIKRYLNETARLYAVMNHHLAGRPFLGDDYSIADMACYPWILSHERQGQNLDDVPHLKRWFDRIQIRPAVIKAYAEGKTLNTPDSLSAEARRVLFDQNAATVKK